MAGNALSRSTWRFTTVDTVRPVVTSREPEPGATGVDRNVNVTATFDEAVTGVSGSTMTLNLGTTQVPVTVTYDAETRTATMDPNVVLTANRRYTARLTSGIKDLRGNTLPAATWQFTTGTTITPAE